MTNSGQHPSAAEVTLSLDGVSVVEFGQFVSGPGAGQILGDLGADVIKVEPPAGEAAWGVGNDTSGPGFGRAIYLSHNRGKRSICLDLTTSHGRDVAMRLVGAADIVIHNMRPGVMERFHLGPRDCLAIKPNLVYVAISGFGADSDVAARPGLDTSAQAESGMMTINGEPGQGPLRVGFTVIDAATCYVAAMAALAGLTQVARTGVGFATDVSLRNVGLHLQGQLWGDYFLGGVVPGQLGNGQAHVCPAAEIVPVADGHIVLSAYADHKWRALCSAIGKPEFGTDPRYATNGARVARRDEVLQVIFAGLAGRTRRGAVEVLNAHGVVSAEVLNFREVADRNSNDIGSNPAFMAVEGGAVDRAVRTPIGAGARRTSPPPPRFPGEHSAEILAELGYDEESLGDGQRVVANG